MKKIVQRFALAFLLLLPMLANATVSNVSVNYAARGSATIHAANLTAYDTVFAVVNPGYQLIDATSWLNSDVLIVPGTTTGTLAIEQNPNDASNYWLILDKNTTWDIKVKFFPTTPAVTITDPHGSATGAGTYTYGDDVTFATASVDDGYTFLAWVNTDDTDDTLSKDDHYNFHIVDNMNVTVAYKPAKRTVRLYTTYPGAAEELTFTINDTLYTIGDAFEIDNGESLTLTCTGVGTHFQYFDDGVNYGKWGFDADLDGTYETSVLNVTTPYTGYVVTSDLNVMCYIDAAVSYTVTANGEDADDLGTVTIATVNTPTVVPGPYAYGDTLRLTPNPNESYYTFKYWTDDVNNSDNPRIVVVTADAAYEAHFDYVKYPVKVAGEHFTFSYKIGSETVDTTGGIYYGSALTITATPDEHYTFVKWSDENTENPRTVYVWNESSVDLTAVYAAPYTVTAEVAAACAAMGTIDAGYESQEIAYGEDFTLKATANSGYQFVEWQLSGSTVSTSATYNGNLDSEGDRAYTAVFEPVSYTVAVSTIEPTAAGTVDGTGSYDYNTPATLTATPAQSYIEFAGWYNGTTLVSEDNSYTFTVTEAVDLTAKFDTLSYDVTVTAGANGSIDPTSANVVYNRVQRFTATPATDYEVDTWTITGAVDYTVAADKSYADVTVGTATEVGVTFKHELITINVACDPVALTGVYVSNANPELNDVVALTYDAATGYNFVNWTDASDNAVADPANVTVSGSETYTAHFTPIPYTITIAVNDDQMGSATIGGGASATVDYGTTVSALVATSANEGYEFKEWRVAGSVINISTWTVSGDATLTAVFAYSDITVTTKAVEYNTDPYVEQATWGTVAVAGEQQYTGEITLTATANTHYNFKGWSDGVSDNPRTVILIQDTAFNALFAPDTHTVTLTVNDENMGAITGFTATQAPYGATIDITAVPETHYQFVNWSDATTAATHATITVESDITLQANFAIDQFDVTAVAGANGTVSPTTATADYNTTVTLTATPDYGYVIDEWTNDVDATTYTDATITPTITENVTWTASFKLDQFTVTAEAQPSNAAATLTGAGSYDYLTAVTMDQTPATGYVFDKWTDNHGTELASNTFSLTRDTIIYAVYDSVTVNIYTATNDALMGNATASAATAKYNTTVDVTATPEYGYKLLSWNDGTNDFPALSNDTTFKVPATDVTYTATFGLRQFTVTADVNDANMGSVAGDGDFDYNTAVTLTATPNEGYQFVKFVDNHDNVITMPFTLTKDTAITAVFEAKPYTVTVVVNESVRGYVQYEGATVSAPLNLHYGDEVTLTAVANYGYEFQNWNQDNETATTFTFTLHGDTTVTANFYYQQFTVTLNGTNATVTGDGDYYYGNVATVSVTGNTDHYNNWKGWSDENGDIVSTALSFDTTVLSNIELTATYDIDTHAVTFSILPATTYGSITGGVDGNYVYGTQIDLTAVPFDEHYTFVQWENNSTDADRTVTVESDTTFEATFAAEQYNFTVASADDVMGAVTGTATGTYDYNTAISVNVTPNTGYHFVMWVDANTGDSITNVLPYEFNIDRDSSIQAVFANDYYTLTLNTPVKEMGWLAINGDTAGYAANGYITASLPTHTDITVVATPNYGYNFANWDDANTDSLRTIQITDNTTMTATFGYNTYTITLDVNDANRGEAVFVGTESYNYGAKDTIQANAAAGYHFLYWAEDNATTNPRVIIVSEDATYTAVFAHDTTFVADDQCDTVLWLNGTDTVATYTASAVESNTFADIYGLDSVVTFTATVRYSTTGTDVQTTCYTSYNWIDGETYTESNNTATWTLTGANAAGCDSTVTLNLTVFENKSIDTTVEACNPYTWYVTGLSYDTEGDFVTNGTDVNGCDSTTSLHLTFTTPKDTTLTTTVCDEFDWVIGGTTHHYDASTSESFSFTDVNQCTATATINLTVNYNTNTAFADEVACDELAYTWANDNVDTTITTSGTYLHSYTAANGCPSVDTVTVTINYQSTGDTAATACETYDWYEYTDMTVSQSVDHIFAGANQYGCDSTVTLNLTINNNTSTVFAEQNVCDQLVFTWTDDTDTTITTSGTYYHSYNTAEGCPSTDEVTVNVLYKVTVEQDTAVCVSYEWNGVTFTESGNIVMNGTAANGCDSTTTLHLTINQPETSEFTVEAYGQYIWDTRSYTASGDYEYVYENRNGCDSTVTMHLTILEPQTAYAYVTVCDSYTWDNELMSDNTNRGDGQTYTTSGTYTYVIRDVADQVDSIIYTLYLTINTLADVEETAVACESYTWTIASTSETFSYTTSGDKVETITDANGCTATATLHLTINNATTGTDVQTACDTYTWIDGIEYTASNSTATFTLSDVNGCDSVVTLNLTVNASTTGIDEQTACVSYTWIDGITYTASNNTATDTLMAANGCDSIVTLNLTISDAVTGTDVQTACESYTWIDGETYTASNSTATYTLQAANGCDSVVTLNLTINNATTGTDVQTACESFTWIDGIEYTASNSTATYTLTDVNGCDSVVTLNLTINTPANTTENATACDTYTWSVNNTTYTTSGTYTAAITDANGCAATATLNLTVNTPANTTESATACDTYTWSVNNTAYTTGGTYTAAITDANGCAATATLTLTINASTSSTDVQTACDTYTWINNTTYTASNSTATYTTTNANGCDSVITLNLTISQSVTGTDAVSGTGSVTYNGVTYTADTVVTVTYTAANGCDSVVTATITVVPVSEPDTMTVVIAVNDATMGTTTPAAGTYYYVAGDTISLTATANSGYNFVGWVLSYEVWGYQITDTLTTATVSEVVDDYFFDYGITTINFTALFEADTTSGEDTTYYTVTLVSADSAMGTVSEGASVIADSSFTAYAYPVNGYNFVAWLNGTDTVSTDNPYTFTVTGDITLTATFEVDSTYVPDSNYFFVTVLSSDAIMGSVSASDSVLEGETFTVTAYPNAGYHFVSWTNGPVVLSYDNPYTFTPNADITITANFEADAVDTVYYYVNVDYDTTMGTVTGEGRYVEGDVVTLRATANSGYHFVAWMNGSETITTTVEYTFTVTADVNLTAQFAADPVYFTVTGMANDTTMGYVNGSGPYVEGATANLTAQAYEGYHFVRWSTGETTPTISFTVTEDITVIAYFEANSNPEAIDDADMSNVTIYSADSRIFVRGAEGRNVYVYDINGRTVSSQVAAGENVEFRMTTTGVYLVKVGNAPAKRVLVVR